MVSAGDTNYGMNNNSSSSSSSDDTSTDSSTGEGVYDGADFNPNSKGTVDTGQPMPDMPDGLQTDSGNGGDVSVDTKVLKQFADNLETIGEGVKKAWDRADQIQPIKPGLFTEALDLKGKINGSSGSGGLQQNLALSLDSLQTALTHTAEGIRTLANKYSTMEEVNAKAGSELHSLMSQASTDLQQFQQHSSAAGQSLESDTSAAGASGSSGSTGSDTTSDA